MRFGLTTPKGGKSVFKPWAIILILETYHSSCFTDLGDNRKPRKLRFTLFR